MPAGTGPYTPSGRYSGPKSDGPWPLAVGDGGGGARADGPSDGLGGKGRKSKGRVGPMLQSPGASRQAMVSPSDAKIDRVDRLAGGRLGLSPHTSSRHAEALKDGG